MQHHASSNGTPSDSSPAFQQVNHLAASGLLQPPEIFIACSEAEQDKTLSGMLQQGLSHLRRAGMITLWHEGMLLAGQTQQQTMETRLEQATVILLLLSPDFLASDRCHTIMQQAIERQHTQSATVITVLLRPCDWEDTCGMLGVLPTNREPVTAWADIDQAMLDVVRGIRHTIKDLSRQHSSLPDAKQASQSSTLPTFWNLPQRRNPFFTGREQILSRLHGLLTTHNRATLTQALTGLGGIGKTQTAVEYAYRYQHEYQAILWARADSREALTASFVAIADIVGLSLEHKEQDRHVVQAVLQWLHTHTHWLLIVDDIQEIALLDDFLPRSETGHILLTTRNRAVGTVAEALEIEKMSHAESTLFLLRRARLIRVSDSLEMASAEDQEQARAIAEVLDGLPLALDQAGAYIEETGCGLARYLHLYQERRADLLKKRGKSASGHADSVATTFSLCFEKVAQTNAAATDLLRCSALLHPDAIPEEFFREGGVYLGSVLQALATDLFAFEEMIASLFEYSLIQRNTNSRTLSMHRLVQAVLLDDMGTQFQHIWAERVVTTLCQIFPGSPPPPWEQLERYMLHVQVCAALIQKWRIGGKALERWLHHMGHLVETSGFYTLAEQLYLQRNALIKQDFSAMVGTLFDESWAEHVLQSPPLVEMLTSMSPLPHLYYRQGKYAEAEPYLRQALQFAEFRFGPEHDGLLNFLDPLGLLYSTTGRYAEAEQLLLRSLNIRLRTSSIDKKSLANSFNSLGDLYRRQGKYEQAETHLQQALALVEGSLDSAEDEVPSILHNLALLYRAQKKYAEAEPLYQRAMRHYEQSLGPESPYLANVLNSLGALYAHQSAYDKAEPLFLRALAIREKVLGPEHTDVGRTLNNIGNLYLNQNNYKQAQQALQRSLQIYTKSFGPEHVETAMSLTNLGNLYSELQKYAEAENVLEKALDIYEKTIGLHVPDTMHIFQALCIVYAKQKKAVKLQRLCQRILPALRQRLGPHHSEVQAIENMAQQLSQGKHSHISFRHTPHRSQSGKKRKRKKR